MTTTAPKPRFDDRELAERLRQPRTDATLRPAHEAFLELYRRHAPGILAFLATQLSRPDAEEVAQTVWMRVWGAAPTQFHGGHFRGWLYEIARNLRTDTHRRKKLAPGRELDAVPDTRTGPTLDALVEQEREAILEQCLAKLDDRMRSLVQGRLAAEEYTELCRRLQLQAQQGYRMFHAAVKLLRECVQKAGA
jgi:RNA polymerase sigma factor (sigma-70 family)